MAYLLDANVFIQAKNLHYGLDFCPAFWDWLIESNNNELVFSIEKVGDEIEAGADELSQWAKARGAGFFLKPDAALVQALAAVSAWATLQNYEPAAVNTFLQVADYYLVAQALAHKHTVVTHEVPAASTKRIRDSERVYWPWHQMHDAIRDAALGARSIRPRTASVGLSVLLR